MTYRIEVAEELRQRAAAIDAPLASLPPRWLDILAIIAYARQHIEVLKHLVTYPAPSTKSTFDVLSLPAVWRKEGRSMCFVHSPDDSENRITAIRLWTALLESEGQWIHYPMKDGEKGLYGRLQRLLYFFQGDPEERTSPEVEKLCKAFRDAGIMITAEIMSTFISIIPARQHIFPDGIEPCNLAQADMLLSYFPISAIAAKNSDGQLRPGESADLILPLTQWPQNNRDRLTIMRMLLDQGCDPNDCLAKATWSQYYGPRQRDMALHLSAERGDEAMVDLLLEYGARGDLQSGGGERDTAAERASRHGHPQLAARISAA